MEGNHSAAPPDHNRLRAALLNLLLPGGARWPSASSAGADLALGQHADRATLEWINALAASLAECAPDAHVSALAEVERREPDSFARMVRAAYRAYYTTPDVQALIAALANAGPREASPHFDESLVAHVIATTAGQRRL